MALTAAEATRVWGANDRIQVGVIGLGGRGRDHINTHLSMAGESDIAALCDVNQEARERAEAMVAKAVQRKPRSFVDMKDVFADKNVDAVSMPLPNHWHALATIWAARPARTSTSRSPPATTSSKGADDRGGAQVNRMVQIGSQGRSIAAQDQKAAQLLPTA